MHFHMSFFPFLRPAFSRPSSAAATNSCCFTRSWQLPCRSPPSGHHSSSCAHSSLFIHTANASSPLYKLLSEFASRRPSQPLYAEPPSCSITQSRLHGSKPHHCLMRG
ncbi:hypothetical protein BD309DRAFT_961457 [Dichomitus squalens]|nr:hypothetical protein BD309DRAFT_961457 [Dichomitus squalens]